MRRSLEVKCLFFFSIALALVISFSFFLYFKVVKEQVANQNPLMGKLLSEREFLLIHLRVLLRQDQEGIPLSSEDEKNVDEFINSMAVLSEGIGGRQDRPFALRLIRVRDHHPEEDDVPHDEYEKSLIERFSNIEPSEVLKLRRGGSPSESGSVSGLAAERSFPDGKYCYYQPLYLDRSCLNCHQEVSRETPFPLGTLRGVIQATIFEPPAQNEITRLWSILLAAAIVTAFIALIAFYIVFRYVIVKPLRSLQSVTEAIGRGDMTKRAELQTGDEFETLSVAFNRMLRHMVLAQEKLRSANSELEEKVNELAKRSLELFETNKIKSDFMATMSHELRTPLNSILGFSEVLGSIETLDERQKRYVGNINESGRVLLNMINDILDMARLEAGRLEAAPSPFRIETIVDAQIDMARPLADRKNIELAASMEQNLPPMIQDSSRIQQILNNLLSNAIKFTPEGGRIAVEVHRLEGMDNSAARLEIKVIDSGVGIAPEDLAVIFEKFRQASGNSAEKDAITRQYGGSGLGLSIVKELCRLLNGEISVESRLGFGSTFIVLLPWELTVSETKETPMMSDIREFSRSGRFTGLKGSAEKEPRL